MLVLKDAVSSPDIHKSCQICLCFMRAYVHKNIIGTGAHD
jgi:hypothetical protein